MEGVSAPVRSRLLGALTVVLLAATATVTLTAPVAYHRLLFARGQKARLVRLSARLAVCGLAMGLAAVSAVLLLVLDVVTRTSVAVPVTTAFAVLTTLLWLVPAAWRR